MMLWNYHEFGSCLLLEHSILDTKKMRQIWTLKFLEVVWQHILGVVVMSYIVLQQI